MICIFKYTISPLKFKLWPYMGSFSSACDVSGLTSELKYCTRTGEVIINLECIDIKT